MILATACSQAAKRSVLNSLSQFGEMEPHITLLAMHSDFEITQRTILETCPCMLGTLCTQSIGISSGKIPESSVQEAIVQTCGGLKRNMDINALRLPSQGSIR